jgi:hypothetical protein
MPRIGGDERTSDDEPGSVYQVFLADDLTQLLDDSGEHY